MKRNLYGKKMFIADLLIVSLWTLFAWHTLGYGLVITGYIVMRIALCFELKHKSRWAFVSALLFGILFIGSVFGYPDAKVAFEPIKKMIFVAGCLFGFTEQTFDAFGPYADIQQRTILWVLWTIVSSWLVLVPVVCSWCFKSILPLYVHRKKIWWYIGCVIFFSVSVYFDSREFALFFFGLLMFAIPVAYHIIYRGRSMLQFVLNDKVFVQYIHLSVTFTIAMFAGLYWLSGARKIIAILAPIIGYVVLMKAYRVSSIKTFPAFLFGLAGLLYINVYDRMHELVIILLSVGGVLSIVASFLTYRQCKSLFASLFLLLSSVFVFPMLLLSYNPYSNVMNDYVHNFGRNHRGLYMISWKEGVGLRDRYGTIIPPKNHRLYFLDKAENYVAVLQNENPYMSDGYYVYNLKERRVVVTSYIEICDITRIDDNEFMMVAANGRKFASFILPQNQYGIFYKDLEFKPYFFDSETPMQQFIDRVNDDYYIDPENNRYWEGMKQSNPKAYDLLCKTIALSALECSPANDITFANAFADIVKYDSFYKGNTNKALNEMSDLLGYLGCSANQGDLNQCADLDRIIESLSLFMAYDGLISFGEIFHDEYIAWHNLMEAIISYYEFVNYHSEWYSSKPMDMELEKAEWLKERREFVDTEKQILGDNIKYVCCLDSVKTIDDVEEVVGTFQCDYDPDYYHPMYYEIWPAFKSWLAARQNVALTLSGTQAVSYNEVTKELESSYAEIIEGLDISGMHPALDWDGHSFKYHRRQKY